MAETSYRITQPFEASLSSFDFELALLLFSPLLMAEVAQKKCRWGHELSHSFASLLVHVRLKVGLAFRLLTPSPLNQHDSQEISVVH